MRFYHAAKDRIVATPNARLRFFFLGPFHLLWLRLWADAAACAILIWVVVHGSMITVATWLGIAARPDLQAALRASAAVRAAADRGVPADDAFRALIEASLPFYVAGVALLLVMGVLSPLVPSYLRWRFRRLGYLELLDDDVEPEEATS
jgi:hypothetical protein